MGTAFKILFALALAAGIYFCWQGVDAQNARQALGETPDGSVVVGYYVGILLMAALLAALFATSIVPFFAEQAAGLVYGPTEKQELGPHAKALSKAAQGDYEGAIGEYEKVLEKDPEDTLALSEISHIYADRLANPEAGAERLSRALEREWEASKAGFLTFRLADLYWKHLGDFGAARALLTQITEAMPNTTHAANAMHRLRDIGERERRHQEEEFLGGSTGPDDPGDGAPETGQDTGDQRPRV